MDEKLKAMLLHNFYDGDSWKDADATTMTKHGVLDVAEFFYQAGLRRAQTVVEEKYDDVMHYDDVAFGLRTDILTALSEEIKNGKH